jgi:hypothetical protein
LGARVVVVLGARAAVDRGGCVVVVRGRVVVVVARWFVLGRAARVVVVRGGLVVVVAEAWVVLVTGRRPLVFTASCRRLMVSVPECAGALGEVRVVDVGRGRVVVGVVVVVGADFTVDLEVPGRDADPKYLVPACARVVLGCDPLAGPGLRLEGRDVARPCPADARAGSGTAGRVVMTCPSAAAEPAFAGASVPALAEPATTAMCLGWGLEPLDRSYSAKPTRPRSATPATTYKKIRSKSLTFNPIHILLSVRLRNGRLASYRVPRATQRRVHKTRATRNRRWTDLTAYAVCIPTCAPPIASSGQEARSLSAILRNHAPNAAKGGAVGTGRDRPGLLRALRATGGARNVGATRVRAQN